MIDFGIQRFILLFNLGWPELVLVFAALLLIFGAKRLPEIAQGLGKGVREFKKALKETEDEVKSSLKEEEPKKKINDDRRQG